jgi:predicted nucleic acid-binding protein
VLPDGSFEMRAQVRLTLLQAVLPITRMEVIKLGGEDQAIKAAKNYRTLRKLGFTIRKTIDTLIATRCIEDGYTLLHDDGDFMAFEKHLGLSVVM